MEGSEQDNISIIQNCTELLLNIGYGVFAPVNQPSLRLGKGSTKKIKTNYGKFHNGSGPPLPPGYGKKNIFFLKQDHFLRTFCKKCIFTIENPKKLRNFFKK